MLQGLHSWKQLNLRAILIINTAELFYPILSWLAEDRLLQGYYMQHGTDVCWVCVFGYSLDCVLLVWTITGQPSSGGYHFLLHYMGKSER